MEATSASVAAPPPSASPIDQPARYPYQPSLDGIRALAVMGVLLFHFEVDGFDGGFLGVDVFLALSGFLITTLLLREFAETRRIRIGAFYGRRARRLLPCLFLVVAAVALFGRYAADEFQLEHLRGDALSSILYVANWRFIGTGGGYFEQLLSPSPLRHVWSLAIEEQWYLVWPLVVMAGLMLVGLPAGRRRWVWVGFTALGAIASAGLMALLVDDENVNRVYYGTDTRAQALLVGTVLAVLVHGCTVPRRWRRTVDLLGLVGLAGCVAMFVAVDATDVWMYRGGFALIAVFAALLVAGAALPKHGATRSLLSLPPLPALGRISYGVYLWHWPVFVYLDEARTGIDGASLFAVRFAVTILVSIASYEMVERPIRQRAWRRVGGVALAGAGCALAVVLAVAVIPGRPGEASADASSVRAADAIGERVLVAGDSVAFNIAYWEPKRLQDRAITVTDATVLGCGIPVPDDTLCAGVFDDWRASIDSFDPDVTVLALGRWELQDRVIGGRSFPVGSRRSAAVLSEELDRGLAILTARGGRVAVLTAPSCFPAPGSERRYSARAAEWINEVFREVAADHAPLVDVVEYGAFQCPNGPGTTTGPVETKADGVHLGEAGTTAVWEWLAGQPIVTGAGPTS